MPRYTVTENPPPFKTGESTTTEIDTDADIPLVGQRIFSNPLVDTPAYTIIQSVPARPPKTIVNTTVINNTTIINPGENVEISAEYFNTLSLSNISGRTLLSNNGAGPDTYDDNNTPIWNTAFMRIESTVLKEVLDIQLSFTVNTDTLGGAFEIESNNGAVIDIIEEEITIQQQDYTIALKIIVDQDSIDNGIQFFITPELGMTISVTNYSLLIIKGQC